MVIAKCEHCGIEFKAQKGNGHIRRFCSRKCSDEHHRLGKYLTCPVCGKLFYRKPHYFKMITGKWDICCSMECSKVIRSKNSTGKNNHQYGLTGRLNSSFKDFDTKRKNNVLNEIMIYVGDWYLGKTKAGRIPKHRYDVELNHALFDQSFFDEKQGWFYLKDGYVVHHIDCNHENNDLYNLQVLTKSEHVSLHNKLRNQKRDNITGKFIKANNYGIE